MRRLGFLALAVLAAVSVEGSTAWSRSGGRYSGGGVRPCSLDGVNPVYHKNIFGDPAVALRQYGFIQSKDGTWRVVPNCHFISP